MYMPTTGKISEENLIFMTMKKTSAQIGKQRTLFQPMLTAANMSTGANTLMGGKNKNTILLTSKCMRADNKMFVKSRIVLTFTMKKIEGSL